MHAPHNDTKTKKVKPIIGVLLLFNVLILRVATPYKVKFFIRRLEKQNLVLQQIRFQIVLT